MIGNLLFFLVSSSLPIALVGVMMKLNARRWTRLAQAYPAADAAECFGTRTMQTVILVGGDSGWNSYKGIVTVGVTPAGILLRVMRPFSIFHPPLLIPFRDCQCEPRRWYLIKSVQYTLRRVRNVQLIVYADLQEWIVSQAGGLASAQADARTANERFAGMRTTG
ncbi:hypothetical protein [Aeoliella sp. SH292]|uniref:hypothetical protein n=1 Tax=Aeoliella sp. SH292 TaxID=3454464 RepID=UPI003F9EB423